MSGTHGGEQAPRTFLHDGREWVVLDGGRSLTGTGHLAPAPLRLLQFAHADTPDSPLLEVTASPRPVAELHDSELVELLSHARDVPEYAPPDEASTSGRRLRTSGPRGRDRQRGRR